MFFSRFSELSAEKGLSTTAAGREIGISKTTISYWRNNENVIPKNDVLQRIADYFGVSTDYLLGKTDIKIPRTNKVRRRSPRWHYLVVTVKSPMRCGTKLKVL